MGGPALLTTESSLHDMCQGQVNHDTHHLFPREHTLTKTCSMEGHLQLQAVHAAQGISCVFGITLFLGHGEVTGGGKQLNKSALWKSVCVFLALG